MHAKVRRAAEMESDVSGDTWKKKKKSLSGFLSADFYDGVAAAPRFRSR